MKNMKCYGRKKIIVPKEKSFITNFFDGNESSSFSIKISEDKDEGNTTEYKENMYCLFDSLGYNGEFFQKKKKSYCVRSVAKPNDEDEEEDCNKNKENIYESLVLFDDFPLESKESCSVKKVAKPKKIAKNRVRRKKAKGIQHLSTKYCKSLQPRWDEFEKHDLNIEGQENINHPAVIQQYNNSKLSKNINECSQNFPSVSIDNSVEANQIDTLASETCTSSKEIKTVQSKLYFPLKETLESSGELFSEVPNYKKDTKSKNIKKINLRKKHSSHNAMIELEEKISKCMQNVDFFESCNKAINSKISSCKGEINYGVGTFISDTASQETMSVQNSKPVPHLQIISKNEVLYDFRDKIHKNVKNQASFSSEMRNVLPNNEFTKSFKEIHDKMNNFGSPQHSQQRLPELINSCPEVHNLSCSNNLLSVKSADICNSENLILNMPINASLCQEIVPDKSQISDVITTLHSKHSNILHKSTVDSISAKPVCIKTIQSKCSKEGRTKISTVKTGLSHALQLSSKNSSISLNKKTNFSEEKKLKNSTSEKNESNTHYLSPNVSNISYNPFMMKLKGKFHTSTPVTSRNRVNDFVNAEMVILSDDENISESKICSKPYASFWENGEESKHLKSFQSKTSVKSFVNSPNKLASIEVLKSFQCPVSLNLHKSRTSVAMPNKNETHTVSLKKSQSLLNISSVNPSSEKRKSDNFTKAHFLKLCGQDSMTSFADIYDWKTFKVKKIGEGTYGEVFMLSKGKSSSVLKVIPISEDPNVKNLQELSSVYSEVKITKSLSELRCNQTNQSQNFVKIIRSSVVYGSYPAALMKAWDDFSQDRSTYNDRPDIYSEDQLFVILELEYGGKDMSCITLRSAAEAEIILKQIAVSLAVAEEEYSFEHRDLHLGNILVKRNRSKTVSYKIRGKDISFKCLGLQVTIIDFTLSLLSDKGYVYYYDLAEDSLFDQTGDYQFDVYKSMRRHLENKWEECSLYSNILWLKYLCKKMKEFKYTHPSAAIHKRCLKAIDHFNSQLMKCSCALECLETCGITKTAFKRSICDTPRRSILVSRNSIQKSKLSMCN